MPDGSLRFYGSGSVRPEDGWVDFQYEVDMSNRTYRTTRMAHSPSPGEGSEMTTRGAGMGRRSSTTSMSSIPFVYRTGVEALGESSGVAAARSIVPGRYRGRVYVRTLDPPGHIGLIDKLAETRNMLEWSVASTGVMTQLGCWVNAWAANPSALNTHWYVWPGMPDWAGPYYDPRYPGELTLAVWSGYENWDFPSDVLWQDPNDPGDWTYADHFCQQWSHTDATMGYAWSTSHSGDAWFFLSGGVAASVQAY